MEALIMGIVLICIGLVFIIDPTQFLANNEIVSKKINSSAKYKIIYKVLGLLLFLVGIGVGTYGLLK